MEYSFVLEEGKRKWRGVHAKGGGWTKVERTENA